MDEFSWAIGLFEGEGHIHTTGRRLVLGTTDRDVLERFVAAVGIGKVNGPYATRSVKHRPMFRWEVGRWPDVSALLERMLPHLSERRAEKARAVLANPPAYVRGEARTHCPQGHELTDDNVQRDNTGRVRCKTCNRAAARDYYRTQAATARG